MQFVSEKAQSGRLRRLGVSIQTDFWENHQIRTRTSDHTEDEDVNNGIIIQKRYYKDGRLDRTEKDFSPLMMYTYLAEMSWKAASPVPIADIEEKKSSSQTAVHIAEPYTMSNMRAGRKAASSLQTAM